MPDVDQKVIRLLNNSEEALSLSREEGDGGVPIPISNLQWPDREFSLAFKLFLEHHITVQFQELGTWDWKMLSGFVEISLSSRRGMRIDSCYKFSSHLCCF